MRLIARWGESGGQSRRETDRVEVRMRLELGDRELVEGRLVSDSLRRRDSQGLRDLVVVHTVLLVTTAPHRPQSHVSVMVRVMGVHYWLVGAFSVVYCIEVTRSDRLGCWVERMTQPCHVVLLVH